MQSTVNQKLFLYLYKRGFNPREMKLFNIPGVFFSAWWLYQVLETIPIERRLKIQAKHKRNREKLNQSFVHLWKEKHGEKLQSLVE